MATEKAATDARLEFLNCVFSEWWTVCANT
jgi:hypothetical protein